MRAGAALLLAALLAPVWVTSACGGRRILGFGDARNGTLLVRHTEPEPQVIDVGETRIGIAPPDQVTCFRQVPTGSVRIEARPASLAESKSVQDLTRATEITLPPEQPLLWDIDHDQVFSGRVHERLCD